METIIPKECNGINFLLRKVCVSINLFVATRISHVFPLKFFLKPRNAHQSYRYSSKQWVLKYYFLNFSSSSVSAAMIHFSVFCIMIFEHKYFSTAQKAIKSFSFILQPDTLPSFLRARFLMFLNFYYDFFFRRHKYLSDLMFVSYSWVKKAIKTFKNCLSY